MTPRRDTTSVATVRCTSSWPRTPAADVALLVGGDRRVELAGRVVLGELVAEQRRRARRPARRRRRTGGARRAGGLPGRQVAALRGRRASISSVPSVSLTSMSTCSSTGSPPSPASTSAVRCAVVERLRPVGERRGRSRSTITSAQAGEVLAPHDRVDAVELGGLARRPTRWRRNLGCRRRRSGPGTQRRARPACGSARSSTISSSLIGQSTTAGRPAVHHRSDPHRLRLVPCRPCAAPPPSVTDRERGRRRRRCTACRSRRPARRRGSAPRRRQVSPTSSATAAIASPRDGPRHRTRRAPPTRERRRTAATVERRLTMPPGRQSARSRAVSSACGTPPWPRLLRCRATGSPPRACAPGRRGAGIARR